MRSTPVTLMRNLKSRSPSSRRKVATSTRLSACTTTHSGAASTTAWGKRWPILCATCGPDRMRVMYCRSDPSHPLQRLLPPGIDQTNGQDHDEDPYLHEAVDGHLAEGHRPGIEEDGLHVEDHEQEGEEVVAEVEPHPGATL